MVLSSLLEMILTFHEVRHNLVNKHLCQMLNIIAGDATSRSVRVTMCPAAQNFQSDQVTKIEVLGRQKYFHFHTTEMEPF